MLSIQIDEEKRIAILEPHGALSADDFALAAKTVDPYIEKYGHFRGLIIHVRSFPGWESFGAFVSHMKFVKDHHRKVSHIAISTDSVIGTLAEHITSHFVSAQIRSFAFDEIGSAKAWILGQNDLDATE